MSNFNKTVFTKTRLVTFVLPFLALLSLFFSSISFAVPDQNQDQTIIRKRLVSGAPSCSISREDDEALFQNAGGHCYGFSAVWLYSKWQQFAHPEKGNWYQSTVTDILGDWSDCDNIRKFASLVRKFQDSQHFGAFEKEMNQLGTDEKKLQREYSIASLLTLNQLKQLLRENVLYDHKLVLIDSHNHATALFKDGGKYYYFNSNTESGEHSTTSTDEVAYLIFRAHSFDSEKPSPLAFEIFSFDEKTPNYPSQQEVLDRIGPSLIGKSNYADENTGLHMAAKIGCLESVRYFLNKGAYIDSANTEGSIALVVAAQDGHLETVRLLLEKGAGINKADNDGWTALMYAAKNGHYEVAQLLLEKGADVNKTTNSGDTALMLVAQNGRLEVMRLLLEKGADVNKAANRGYTALIYAAQNNQLDVVHILLERGADINKADNKGGTALMGAAEKDYLKIVQLLFENGANPDLTTKDGWTALIFAAQYNYPDVVRILIDNGADPNKKNDDGFSAIDIAKYNGHENIVKILTKTKDDL